ncbi:MAG: hypothetical protein R2834_22355 [Rhodothermales bacterium]
MLGAIRTAGSRAYGSLQRSVQRFLLTTIHPDPWMRYRFAVPVHAYGAGSRHPFSWYFSGSLSDSVRSIDDVRQWVLDCDYARDVDQFDAVDYWQHPLLFERKRVGDCEDFSLWTWRRLVELGYDAEFVAGWIQSDDCTRVGHTWVMLRDGDEALLFDPVIREPERVVMPLEALEERYIPHVSVDRALQGFVYGGYYTALSDRWNGR